MRFATLIWLFVFLTLSASCVSVNLGSRDLKRAKGVRYSEPASPFVQESREDVDGAWKNPNNGNLISFLSDCHDESDPPLDYIVNGAFSGVSDLKYEKRETTTVQGREARRAVASGKVDGVGSKMDLLVFKRDNCIYILTYVGVLSAFDQNHEQFDKFVGGFKAP